MAKIDEVSNVLGNLDGKVDNLQESIREIEQHLKQINGIVAKHSETMPKCIEKFNQLEKDVGSVKFDYKFYSIIAGIVIIVNVIIQGAIVVLK